MVREEYLDSFKHHYQNIQSSSLMVFLKDLTGKIVYCSDSFANFFQSMAPIHGGKTSELFKKDADLINKTDRQIIESKESVTLEVLFEVKESQKHIKLEKMPYFDAQKNLSGILVFASDITQESFIKLQAKQLYIIMNAHLKAEETLKNTSEVSDFPQLLAENLSSDELFKAVMIERILNSDDNQTIGFASWYLSDGSHQAKKTINSLCNQCRDLIEKDEDNNFFIKENDSQCPWSNHFEKSKVFVSKIQYGSKLYGSLCIRLDESWQVEKRANDLLNQLAGKIAFGFYSLETQAQIAEIQNEMESRLKIYKIALDSINDGVWEWDIETNKAFFSDKYYTMLGYIPGEFEPSLESWEKLVHPEDVIEAKRIIQLHFESKQEAYEIEFRMKTKSGDYKWILGRGK
ncbi:MAG: PAS domain-containing protein, partial [Thermotogota bacterium]|nr:PAS domain-containing protein [Thermotogota bacterium]